MTEHPEKPEPRVNELGSPTAAAPDADKPKRTRKRAPRDLSAKFVVEACRHMHDLHCENIVAYDVRGKSDVTDYILIASGTSDRQMRSLADDFAELGRKFDLEPYGTEIDGTTTWIVIDFVDAVVHLFEPQVRAFYDLEMLWGDCPKVEWKR
jgi:ribosome-associated protein